MVWQVRADELGNHFVEVAEVWAVGYRKDSEVYAEVEHRVMAARDSPLTRALSDVVEMFAKAARGLEANPEPEVAPPVPAWLREALLHVVHLPRDEVDALSFDEAHAEWQAYITGPGL